MVTQLLFTVQRQGELKSVSKANAKDTCRGYEIRYEIQKSVVYHGRLFTAC